MVKKLNIWRVKKMRKREIAALLAAVLVAALSGCGGDPTEVGSSVDFGYSKKVITGSEEIAAFAEEIGFEGDLSEVAEIYDVTCARAAADAERSWGDKYYFENVTEAEVKGELIGTTASEGKWDVVCEKEPYLTAPIEIADELIEEKFGVRLGEKVELKAEQIVENGEYEAYVKVLRYTFDMYENDLFADDYVGQGVLEVPVGITFVRK